MLKLIRHLILGASVLALPVQAEEPLQSFETCSLITSEYFTVLQLVSRGFEREALKESLPGISNQARKRVDALIDMAAEQGLPETYSMINSEYARCARKVYQRTGIPPVGTREAHFHFCAGENKVRYEIAMAAFVGAPREKVLAQLRPGHVPVAEAIYDMQESDGFTAVMDNLASELKHCLNNNL